MPTTSLSGWLFTNQGPLTTTYTAPASCFTEASRVQLATQWSDTDSNMTSLLPYQGICKTATTVATWGDCLPSGKNIDSEYATIDTNNPAAGSTVDYYSPGLICPSGYTTAGVAANDAGTITSSGKAFVPTTTVDNRFWGNNPVPNVLLQALDQGETAILCCPRYVETRTITNPAGADQTSQFLRGKPQWFLLVHLAIVSGSLCRLRLAYSQRGFHSDFHIPECFQHHGHRRHNQLCLHGSIYRDCDGNYYGSWQLDCYHAGSHDHSHS